VATGVGAVAGVGGAVQDAHWDTIVSDSPGNEQLNRLVAFAWEMVDKQPHRADEEETLVSISRHGCIDAEASANRAGFKAVKSQASFVAGVGEAAVGDAAVGAPAVGAPAVGEAAAVGGGVGAAGQPCQYVKRVASPA